MAEQSGYNRGSAELLVKDARVLLFGGAFLGSLCEVIRRQLLGVPRFETNLDWLHLLDAFHYRKLGTFPLFGVIRK